MKPLERRTQVERRELAERRVLDATVALIADQGSRAVTLEAVGGAAGYSRGIVTHHFGSRAELLRRVVEHTREFDRPHYDGDGLRWLTTTVRAYLDNIVASAPSARAFLRMWSEAIASDPVLQPLFAVQDAHLRHVLAEMVRAGVADGSIHPGVDVSSSAAFVAACLRGMGMQLIATPAVGPTGAVIDQTVRLIETAFSSQDPHPAATGR